MFLDAMYGQVETDDINEIWIAEIVFHFVGPRGRTTVPIDLIKDYSKCFCKGIFEAIDI